MGSNQCVQNSTYIGYMWPLFITLVKNSCKKTHENSHFMRPKNGTLCEWVKWKEFELICELMQQYLNVER